MSRLATSLFPDDFYRNLAEFCVDPAPSTQRPPIVKIYLHWPPHRDPSCNCETLPQDSGPRTLLPPQQCLDDREAGGQERQADKQTRPALLHEVLEFQVNQLGAVREVIVDGLADQFRRILFGPSLQINAQIQPGMGRKFFRPAHNEFFRFVVQILFDERGRVHRVEELAKVAELQLDTMRPGREPFLIAR